MIDEFNLNPPVAPPEGLTYLTNTLGSPLALLIKDTVNYYTQDQRDAYHTGTVQQFVPGDIITEDMLDLTEAERSTFIARYIKTGILSNSELVATPPIVGVESVSTCNYSISLHDNGSTSKETVSYDASFNHLQVFPVSYNETIVAIYYRDSDGISYSIDNGKNIIKVKGTAATNLNFPEEITSCAAFVYTSSFNTSLIKTKLYIGTLREGLKSLTSGQSSFVQETDLEKGHFSGIGSSTYFFRENKWNISKIKDASGNTPDYLFGNYQPCYVIGILNYPKEFEVPLPEDPTSTNIEKNTILVYVKNTIIDETMTSSVEDLYLESNNLKGILKVSGVIKPKYTFFTKSLGNDSASWRPFYPSDEIKKLDICDILRSTNYNSVLNFNKTTPLEVGQIVAIASPKNYVDKYVTRLLKYYYDTATKQLMLTVVPKFVYASIKLPYLIDPSDPDNINDRASITVDGNTQILIFTNGSLFETQWVSFAKSLKIIWPNITFVMSPTYELKMFSNDSISISTDRFIYEDLDLNPKNLTGLSCYYDFEIQSESRTTVFLTEYDKIWKFNDSSWGSGPWISSDNLTPELSFRLDKNLNFTFLNLENKVESDQIDATTTYLNGIRNFCLYKPKYISSYMGYCGSDMGLIQFEFIYNPVENDTRFLNNKRPHVFDKKLYSSWNTDLVFDLPSKAIVGCGLFSHPMIIYDFISTDNIPIRYYHYDPSYLTTKSIDTGIIKSKLFYKNYFVEYVTQADYQVIEDPVETLQENIGTIAYPDNQLVYRYAAINAYNFIPFQETRIDQIVNNDNNSKEFIRMVPRFSGKTSFINTVVNSASKFSFINIKSNLYENIAMVPLSIEYPENSGTIEVLYPSNMTYNEDGLVFSLEEIDSITLLKSKNSLATYLYESMVKYNKYKLRLRAAESPGAIFDSSILYENDAEFLLIMNEGI